MVADNGSKGKDAKTPTNVADNGSKEKDANTLNELAEAMLMFSKSAPSQSSLSKFPGRQESRSEGPVPGSSLASNKIVSKESSSTANCYVCNLRFKSKWGLYTHVKVHKRNPTCPSGWLVKKKRSRPTNANDNGNENEQKSEAKYREAIEAGH